MKAEVLIRPYILSDLDPLVNLIHTTIKSCYPACYEQEVIDFFINYHSSDEVMRKSKEGSLLVAVLEKKLIASGYLVGEEIGGVYVHPDYQKRGFAKKMVEALLAEATAQKLQSVWLESTPIALKLYQKLGFHILEERVMFVENEVPLPYFHMGMNLGMNLGKK